jgi:hypothetical protein
LASDTPSFSQLTGRPAFSQLASRLGAPRPPIRRVCPRRGDASAEAPQSEGSSESCDGSGQHPARVSILAGVESNPRLISTRDMWRLGPYCRGVPAGIWARLIDCARARPGCLVLTSGPADASATVASACLVRAGDVVWNPLTGEKAMIVESASDSGGTRIVADLAVEAGGFVPGGHRVATTSALRTCSPPCDASADTQRNYSARSPNAACVSQAE